MMILPLAAVCLGSCVIVLAAVGDPKMRVTLRDEGPYSIHPGESMGSRPFSQFTINRKWKRFARENSLSRSTPHLARGLHKPLTIQ